MFHFLPALAALVLREKRLEPPQQIGADPSNSDGQESGKPYGVETVFERRRVDDLTNMQMHAQRREQHHFMVFPTHTHRT